MTTPQRERHPRAEAPSTGFASHQAAESTSESTAPDLLSHAVAGARAGLDVLPLVPGGKTPLGALAPHGKDDASSDVEQVRDWWCQCPDANIGVRPAVGVVVVDVDPRDGGATALVELTRPHGGLTPTRCAWTGGNGLHAWYRAAGQFKRRLCRGVDLKGHGGYVVAPPSLHPSGRRYVWANDLPIADAPPWLVALMRKSVLPLRPALGVLGGVASARADDALVGVVARARTGGRNAALHWAACRAAERGSPPALVGKLRRAGLGTGLPAEEIERTLASAAGVAHA